MDPITWRFIERILAVAIGGLAIYLGYRLFTKIPESRDSQGRVVLPWNMSIAVNRVGPGVFFALFGAIVVGYALNESVRYLRETSQPTADGVARIEREIFGGVAPTGKDALAAARLRARAQIEFLNSARRTLRESADDPQRQRIDRNITAIKLAIMEPLWERGVWGDRAAFRDWAEGGAEAPVPPGLEAAAAFYRSGQEGK